MMELKFCGKIYKSTDEINSKTFEQIMRNGLYNDALSTKKQDEIYDFCRQFDGNFLKHLDAIKMNQWAA